MLIHNESTYLGRWLIRRLKEAQYGEFRCITMLEHWYITQSKLIVSTATVWHAQNILFCFIIRNGKIMLPNQICGVLGPSLKTGQSTKQHSDSYNPTSAKGKTKWLNVIFISPYYDFHIVNCTPQWDTQNWPPVMSLLHHSGALIF